MKKILVPTDFSTNSIRALRYAAEIAAQNDASIEILNVNTNAIYTAVMPEYYEVKYAEFEDYVELVIDDLNALKKDITDLKVFEDLEISVRVEEGELHTTLNFTAENDHCDLIIMGSMGATGATEFFVGSNAEKVIRTATCPVLVVPALAKDFKLKTVVLATTLRTDQMIAFVTLAAWQKYFDFDVKILYLNNPNDFETKDEIGDAAKEYCKVSGLKNTVLSTNLNTFNEQKKILQFAEKNKADLIVMATHQRQGISHLLFGSMTENEANHSKIPILCVPMFKQ
jgi:nucleotide-binding universal stress UspA family protein